MTATTAAVGSPLDWPARRDRTPSYKRNQGKPTVGFIRAANELIKQVRMIKQNGGKFYGQSPQDITVSTDVPLKPNGHPYVGQDQPSDPGVCVRFRIVDRWYAISCDRWKTPAANLNALATVVEHLRAVSRYANGDDFVSLMSTYSVVEPTPQRPKPPPPPEPPPRSWYTGWPPEPPDGPPKPPFWSRQSSPPPPPRPPQPPRPGSAPWEVVLGVTLPCTRDDVDRAYRRLAREHHPDRGGDVGQMQRINDAYAQFQRQYPKF